MGSVLTIAIGEPMLKTPLSLALRNLLKKTVFDVEPQMKKTNDFLSMCLFQNKNKRKEFHGNDHL